jgi:hypothetical protein
MKMIILIIIIVAISLSLGLWLIASGNATSEETNMNYGIFVATDRISYTAGEPIIMNLKIFNYTEEDIIFQFNSAQRYDFIIKDENGNEVWRCSEGRMFAQMLGEEILGPTNTEILYTAKYSDKLSMGYYKVTGVLVAQEKPMSGSIIIEVK